MICLITQKTGICSGHWVRFKSGTRAESDGERAERLRKFRTGHPGLTGFFVYAVWVTRQRFCRRHSPLIGPKRLRETPCSQDSDECVSGGTKRFNEGTPPEECILSTLFTFSILLGSFFRTVAILCYSSDDDTMSAPAPSSRRV
jgi:hypothetical protein